MVFVLVSNIIFKNLFIGLKLFLISRLAMLLVLTEIPKQAGAELGQAQIKLELGFTLIILLN